MEKRIELESRARKADQITELILDNCRSTSIVGLTNEYTALETLSLINVGLTTLKGFPALPNLKRLELSDNRISNGLNHLVACDKLQYLNLSGNKIQKLENLKPLQQLRSLVDLDLFNNEATQIKDYREQVFAMLPTLKYLDGFDRNDEEANLEDDEEVNVNASDDEESASDDDDDDEDDEDFDEVLLSEVYNEDDEENYSEWDGEDAGDDYDDEIESEDDDVESDDDEGGSPSKKPAATPNAKGGKAGAKESKESKESAAATSNSNNVSANESSSSKAAAAKTSTDGENDKKADGGEEVKENSNANKAEDEAAVNATNDDETQARGKKRKHDG